MLISFFNPSDLIGCGGDINQSDSFRYVEGVRGGGMWRGYAEGVCGGACRGVSLLLIRLCGEVSLQLFSLCGGVSLQLFKLCGGVSLQLGCVEGCHSN